MSFVTLAGVWQQSIATASDQDLPDFFAGDFWGEACFVADSSRTEVWS